MTNVEVGAGGPGVFVGATVGSLGVNVNGVGVGNGVSVGRGGQRVIIVGGEATSACRVGAA